MPHEIIGELLVGVAELGISAAGDNGSKKSGCGCLILTLLLMFIVGGIYYYSTLTPTPQTKGLVTKKLSNDRMLIKTNKTEDIYTITHDLYLNKKVGDSIVLNH